MAADNTQLLGPYPDHCREYWIPFFYDKPYTNRIGVALQKMPLGGVFDIAAHVRTDNREKFINVVKTYIDHSFGNHEGWELEFNSNFSRIIKVQTLSAMLAEAKERKNGRQRQRNWRDEYPAGE